MTPSRPSCTRSSAPTREAFGRLRVETGLRLTVWRERRHGAHKERRPPDGRVSAKTSAWRPTLLSFFLGETSAQKTLRKARENAFARSSALIAKDLPPLMGFLCLVMLGGRPRNGDMGRAFFRRGGANARTGTKTVGPHVGMA